MQELRKRLAGARRALSRLEKQVTRLESLLDDATGSPFPAADVVAAVGAELAAAGDLAALERDVRQLQEDAEGRLQPALKGAAARLASGVAEALRPLGLRVEGHLPELRAGCLTLAFELDASPRSVRVLYGPGVATLGRAEPETAAVARVVEKAWRELNTPQELDEARFLDALGTAYDRARAVAGQPPAWAAPIVEVLAELAFVRQPARFRTDPRRESFVSYGRVPFSYDLGRLRRVEHEGRKLVLGVATRQQARRTAEHLWVPRGEAGRGTHYATVAFSGGGDA